MVDFNTYALTLSLAESFLVSLLVTYILLPWVMANMRMEKEPTGAFDSGGNPRGFRRKAKV